MERNALSAKLLQLQMTAPYNHMVTRQKLILARPLWHVSPNQATAHGTMFHGHLTAGEEYCRCRDCNNCLGRTVNHTWTGEIHQAKGIMSWQYSRSCASTECKICPSDLTCRLISTGRLINEVTDMAPIGHKCGIDKQVDAGLLEVVMARACCSRAFKGPSLNIWLTCVLCSGCCATDWQHTDEMHVVQPQLVLHVGLQQPCMISHRVKGDSAGHSLVLLILQFLMPSALLPVWHSLTHNMIRPGRAA